MTLYDQLGTAYEVEISDNSEIVQSLSEHSEKLDDIYELLDEYSENIENIEQCQADISTALQEQNDKLTEMNQYVAYIFVIVLAFLLYRILSSALSSMFGGG